MAKSAIVFKGRGIDSHTLGADDLKKAGVEGFKSTTFRKNVAVDVDADVAKAILGNRKLFGHFEKAEAETEETPTAPTPTPSK